jgi:Uma2 family endonuclease
MGEPPLEVSKDVFVALAAENPELLMEPARDGTLIVMPPTGSNASRRNVELLVYLGAWNRTSRAGIAFDSSGGFELSDSAIR